MNNGRNGWMLKACFYLLSVVVMVQMLTIMAGGATCFYLFVMGQAAVGACSSFTEQVREIWAEVLAAILALLLPSRGSNGSHPPPS